MYIRDECHLESNFLNQFIFNTRVVKKIQSEINVYKNEYIQANPTNTLALLFKMSQPIDNFLNKTAEEKKREEETSFHT